MAQNWHTAYADRKNGRRPVDYPHPDLEPILSPTYGLMIYQEQLMLVAQRLAGYTLEEADNLRKATGKKDRALIAQERSKFVDGCVAQGHDRAFGERIFDTIEPFADYSFNKSHSVGYGYLAYQTAYLKANYPVEYLAALLTSVRTNKDQTAVFLVECRQQHIEVLVPDVNESVSDFSVHADADGRPVDPLRALRGPQRRGGRRRDDRRRPHRGAGPFQDFHDFCARVDPAALNKRTIESLIKAGGFDSLGHPRQGLLHAFEPIIDQAVTRRRERDAGIMSLFGDGHRRRRPGRSASRRRFPTPSSTARPASTSRRRCSASTSATIRCSAPRARCAATSTAPSPSSATAGRARRSTVGGIVTSLARKYTQKGDLMATLRARGPRRRARRDGVPEDDDRVRPPARGRRHRVRHGPGRPPRRPAQDRRDGAVPTRDHARRGTPPCGCACRSPALRRAASTSSRELLAPPSR